MFFSHECNFQGLPKDLRHRSDYDGLWRVAWTFVTWWRLEWPYKPPQVLDGSESQPAGGPIGVSIQLGNKPSPYVGTTRSCLIQLTDSAMGKRQGPSSGGNFDIGTVATWILFVKMPNRPWITQL
ncbi:hypothetical protein N7524_004455 [Penicillium chrysogenum]|nr:hypothetical protein N7524_004455 [Penicillium chrysogenum]